MASKRFTNTNTKNKHNPLFEITPCFKLLKASGNIINVIRKHYRRLKDIFEKGHCGKTTNFNAQGNTSNMDRMKEKVQKYGGKLAMNETRHTHHENENTSIQNLSSALRDIVN